MGPRFDCTSIAWAVTLAVGCGAPSSAPTVGAAPVLRGTVLEARDEQGHSAVFRIDDVQHGTDLSLYTVSLRDADGWRPYCRSGAATVVVPGSWGAHGDYVDDAALTTFACIDGAIGKCVALGYAPWASFAGVSLRDHHLACVRLLRADYCGDGTSHTADGTPIEIWDSLGVVARGDVDLPTAFEAAWSEGGAVYLAAPRHGEVHDIVARCPSRLAGRTSLELAPDQVAARFPEALLFTARVVERRR